MVVVVCVRAGARRGLSAAPSIRLSLCATLSVSASLLIADVPTDCTNHATPSPCSKTQRMGYDEEQWGRPRWEWIAQARQEIYDETFLKIGSMGWMFVPIESYNGGASSILEPIAEHLPEYEYVLATYFGTVLCTVHCAVFVCRPGCFTRAQLR